MVSYMEDNITVYSKNILAGREMNWTRIVHIIVHNFDNNYVKFFELCCLKISPLSSHPVRHTETYSIT